MMHGPINIRSLVVFKKKNLFSFPVTVNNSIKLGPLVFLVINVCNHGEHYETPCIICIQSVLGHKFLNFGYLIIRKCV